MIIYEGPSLLDSKPIVVLTTTGSKNDKTGDMIQTWIMRADVAPNDAIKNGCDSSVCGDCKLRSNGCYVVVYQAPLSTWRRYKLGGHAMAEARDVGRGRMVRVGSYGDPAAVPAQVWAELLSEARGNTGYSHQWKKPHAQPLKQLVMASCDTAEERTKAKARGWRTFRVKLASEPVLKGEVVCPATTVGLTCEACGICDGNQRKLKSDVVLDVHGYQTKRYVNLRTTA